MDFVGDFGAKVNTVEQVSTRTFVCIRGQDHHLTMNQCLSYFDSFKLSVLFKWCV